MHNTFTKKVCKLSNDNSPNNLSYFEKLVRALAAIKCWGVLKGAPMTSLYRGRSVFKEFPLYHTTLWNVVSMNVRST